MGIMKKKNKAEKADAPIDNEDSLTDEELSGEEFDEEEETEEETEENKLPNLPNKKKDKDKLTINDVLQMHEERLRMLEFKTGLRTY